jgi:hypothetical protein
MTFLRLNFSYQSRNLKRFIVKVSGRYNVNIWPRDIVHPIERNTVPLSLSFLKYIPISYW